MITKKQLDYFILKEASKALREDLQSDTQDINDEYDEKDEKEQETIKNKTTSLSNGKTDKIYHSNKLAQETGTDSDANNNKKKWQSMVNQDITKANNTKKELDAAKKRANELKTERAAAIEIEKDKYVNEKSEEAEASNEANADSNAGVSITIKENMEQQPQQQPQQQQQQPQQQPQQKKKDLIVRFDKNTTSPFTVKFTNRGFVVGNTRFSFETIEKAISKQFSITLKTGLILTPVKMQKILKYKSRH